MAKKNNYRKFKHPRGFIGLPRHIFESPAYRSLSLTARCLLDEFHHIYRPSLNGRLNLSQETACSRLGVSAKTVSKAYTELIDRGLIEQMLNADWRNGKAREWRITYELYNGREPTNEWKTWDQEK